MRRVLVILLLLLLPARAGELEALFEVTLQDNPTDSLLWAENKQGADVTVTIEMTELTNVRSVEGQRVTLTVPPYTRVEAVHLLPVDPVLRYRYNYTYRWTWGSLTAKHDPQAVYDLPYKSATFQVVQGFNGSFSHTGELAYAVDFDLPEGTLVCAARDGTVVRTEDSYTEGGVDKRLWTRANAVLVRHADGTIGEYDHLKPQGVLVKPGDKVKVGDGLGYSGNTGFSQSPHLHFVVYRAQDGFLRQSFPIRFRLAGKLEPEEPVEGKSYTAP